MPLLGSKHNDEVVDPSFNNNNVGNAGVTGTGTGTTTDPNVGHSHLGTHNTTGLSGNNQNTTGLSGTNQNTTGLTGTNQNTAGFTGNNRDNLATGTSSSANTGGPLAGGQTTDTTGHHHHQHNVGTGVGAGTAAAGTGAGFNAADPATHESHGNPLYPSPHAPGAAQVNDGTTTTGTGTGTGTGHPHSSQVKTASGKSASTQAIIGKIEQVVGTVLHSTSLKEKGLAKEQEAEAAKMQQAELAHAEGLEGQANLARDRANVHSAHGAAHAHGATGADVNYAAGPTQVGQGFQQPALGIQGAGGAGSARAI